MHVRALSVSLAVLAVAVVAVTSAAACGCDGDTCYTPVNLRATAGLRPALRAAFLKAHPDLDPAAVSGPMPGRTYYGSQGDFHAVATFQVDGQPAYPATFWRDAGHAWRFSHDTHGGVRNTDISPDLLLIWGFRQWRHSPFYVEPR